MDLVEVDVIEPEALQAVVDAREDVRAREPDLVRTRAHATADLRRDDHLLARTAERLQGGARERLRFAFGVHVRGVDEVDARVERAPDDPLDLFGGELPDHFPEALATERHRPEAQLRDVQPRFPENVESHDRLRRPRVRCTLRRGRCANAAMSCR